MLSYLLFFVSCILVAFAAPDCNGTRPPPSQRLFNSSAIEKIISSYLPRFKDPVLAKIFENTLPNCLDSTVVLGSLDDSFIITGDINAMWLRDSTNQLMPYVEFAPQDVDLRNMICGAIKRQSSLVMNNRYANAFNRNPTGDGHRSDEVHTNPQASYCEQGLVFENKYELDSLVNVLKLANAYYNVTRDLDCLKSSQYPNAVKVILDTLEVQQAGTDEEFDSPAYTFNRLTSTPTDTLMNGGRGVPASRCGLVKSAFRPSDDSSHLPFPIAANAYASVELSKSVNVLNMLQLASLSGRAANLSKIISQAIQQNGIMNTPAGPVFAYEVDGFGNVYSMDDANIPSLLALPYLGFIDASDPLYLRTRARLLSASNPWFFKGSAAEGIGGPHVGTNMIWPMSIIMRALTSTDDNEILSCLHTLSTTHNNMFFMHESFDKNDPGNFTRRWFSWANSLFGQLILSLAKQRPNLIFQS